MREPLKRAARLLGAFALGAWLSAPAAGTEDPTGTVAGIEQQWGVRIEGLHLSANGHILDLRYRVLDADKAATLTRPESNPCLIDEATGARMPVPNTPKLGPLRPTALKPEKGRTYFILFANRGSLVKAGSRVTVVIGECRLEHISVE